MMPFEKSSKCSVIESHEVIGPTVGPAVSANQPMIQNSRKTTNVTTPATIWLLVVLEMNSPRAMKLSLEDVFLSLTTDESAEAAAEVPAAAPAACRR